MQKKSETNKTDELIRAMTRPYLAVSGWTVLLILIILGVLSGCVDSFLPKWVIGLLMTPGSVYLTDRTVRKYKPTGL